MKYEIPVSVAVRYLFQPVPHLRGREFFPNVQPPVLGEERQHCREPPRDDGYIVNPAQQCKDGHPRDLEDVLLWSASIPSDP
ncbi:hypothetical protein NDU88_003384 [Pleurodeles waltl]|uniref:Uncharacterized protein n=1 Tax=Pleurodeles waltl TaxID=8319 RepID=A0AAV7UYC2_PLEWA|nr:hypothetical protein NDU88_003384 [Pleurodeles waltl]